MNCLGGAFTSWEPCDAGSHTHADHPRRWGEWVGVVAIILPAFGYAIANMFWASAAGSVIWVGLGMAVVLCVATAIAYGGLERGEAGPGPGSFLARAGGMAALVAGQFWYWIAPGLWLIPAACIAAYMVGQIWPGVGVGNTWMRLGAAGVLGAGLSYVSLRRAGWVAAGIAGIGAAQVAAMVVLTMMAVSHSRSKATGDAVWVLDSTGTPVQYVQDTVPDPARTITVPDASKMIPDPADPTKMIQDPTATTQVTDPAGVPKVDSNGNSVPVYIGVDANGNAITDAGGKPVVVPTDADGKLGTLPPGAAKAEPEPFRVTYQANPPSDDGVFRFLANTAELTHPSPPVTSLKFLFAEGSAGMLALAVFQWVAALGRRNRVGRRVGVVIAVFVVLQCVGFCLMEHLIQKVMAMESAFPLFSAAGSAIPLGDRMQLIGSGLFGSPYAGWWFMMGQCAMLLLVLVGAAWMSFATGSGAAWNGWGNGAASGGPAAGVGDKGPSHRRIVLRAAVTVTLCGIGLLDLGYDSQWLSVGAIEMPGRVAGTLWPDVAGTLSCGVALLAPVMCMGICAMALARGRGRWGTMAAIVGLIVGAGCMAFHLVGLGVLIGEGVRELHWALYLCTAWGVGAAIILGRRAEKMKA